jgi:uncharacterized protein YbbC (DUF1343 family)/CubicO group peptidase (beta-lactamase class C family)
MRNRGFPREQAEKRMRVAFQTRAVHVVLASSIAVAIGTLPVAQSKQAPPAASTGFDLSRLERLDVVINEAIRDKKLPGAVVLVGRDGRTVFRKAYGRRSVTPADEPMTVDTIFDLASLTKVVATTTSVMVLVEEGRIRLNDRVATFIPEFGRYGKDAITVQHLLTHVSGLRPDVDLADQWTGEDTAIRLAVEEVPLAPPGERFVYSDINFFLLGEIVKRVSGERLDVFARNRIFEPLGMRETMFNPPERLLSRIAPTEPCTPYGWPCAGPDARMLRGTVHDPTARRMGGVSGHAGLFGTADDLARFCRMLLNGGSAGTSRILSPLGVARMTAPSTPTLDRTLRGLGWDIDSSYSSNRGELLPVGSFGHTGFTGTSIWIDPARDVFVVFLSNRLHPDGTGDVTPLRARVATVVAAALVDPSIAQSRQSSRAAGSDFGAAGPPPPRPKLEPTLTGIDVLRDEAFARFRGKRVGLVTNHTGLSRDGVSTIDLLHGAKEVRLTSLFSPEHGIRGILDDKVPTERDERTGLPIHSLYGETRRPSPSMLDGLDVVVIDLQDIGTRFYTYMTTTAYLMEEASKRQLPVVVLDRPNPINGYQIEGPSLDTAPFGFTGYISMPVRHGLTLGELARLFNGENKIGAALEVVPMQRWRRDEWFDETGLTWINPSPNMRNLVQATVYPGVGAIETTNISVGRGTDTPFEHIGAPWIDGSRLAAELNSRRMPGIRFYPVRFTPTSSKYQGEACQGVFLIVTDRLALRPVRVGIEIASALFRLHADKFELDAADRLLGSKQTLARIRAGDDPARIAESWAADEARWRLLRAKYLLY